MLNLGHISINIVLIILLVIYAIIMHFITKPIKTERTLYIIIVIVSVSLACISLVLKSILEINFAEFDTVVSIITFALASVLVLQINHNSIEIKKRLFVLMIIFYVVMFKLFLGLVFAGVSELIY